MQTIYNVQDFGAIGDGNALNAPQNTLAFQKAISLGSGVTGLPGPVYVPITMGGFVVNRGQIKGTTPNLKIFGESGMGYGGGATSKIIGQGSGSTLTIGGSGSTVQGIAFDESLPGQGDADASVLVKNNQVMLRDLNISSASIGLSLQLPALAEGEFWLQDILISGVAKVAGVLGNCGNAAIQMRHVLAYMSDPQPPYGVVIESCGELLMSDCDIDNAGTCLALVPGLGGPNQHVDAVIVSDSLFDNGNGFGNVLIQPRGNGFCSDLQFNNVWTSSVNNNKGQWNTNGFAIDGSQANGSLQRPIQNVRLRGCWGRNFVNHCGVFARAVHALSIVDGSFTGNFDGINLQPGCTDFSLRGNYCGDYDIGPVGWPGGPALGGRNTRFGIVLQSPNAGMVMENFLRGNGQGPLMNYAPAIGQQIAFNLP